MIIKNVRLINYRNYDELEIELNNKLNIIIGDNAQGKTNILESIYVLAITKSYLNVNEKDLIKIGKAFSLLESNVMIDGISKKIRMYISSKGKRISINGKDIKRMSDYVSNLKVIIFSPDNIRMVKDGPSVRRKFLNIEISQIDNKYIKYLMDYNNLINQKNEYLKNNDDKIISYLDVINNKLCELAIELTFRRYKFIDDLNSYINDIFYEITGISGLKIKYLNNVDINIDKRNMFDNFLNRLKKYLEKELNYKVSLIGPHRDDFVFELNGKNLAIYGSQGQIRCAILSLKLAEVKLHCKLSNDFPVLLLDDIFSELDVVKKNNLIKYINDNVQTIITTTDLNLINNDLVERANVFKIDGAKLFPGK